MRPTLSNLEPNKARFEPSSTRNSHSIGPIPKGNGEVGMQPPKEERRQ